MKNIADGVEYKDTQKILDIYEDTYEEELKTNVFVNKLLSNSIRRNIVATKRYGNQYLLYGVAEVDDSTYTTLVKMYYNKIIPDDSDCSIQLFLWELFTSINLYNNKIKYSRDQKIVTDIKNEDNIVNCTPLYMLDRHINNYIECGKTPSNAEVLSTFRNYIIANTYGNAAYGNGYNQLTRNIDEIINELQSVITPEIVSNTKKQRELDSISPVTEINNNLVFDFKGNQYLRVVKHYTSYIDIYNRDVSTTSLSSKDVKSYFLGVMYDYNIISNELYKELLNGNNDKELIESWMWSLRDANNINHIIYRSTIHKLLLKSKTL